MYPRSDPVPGGGQIPFFDAIQMPPGMSTGTLTNNVVYLTHTRFDVSITIPKMRLFIGTAAGNWDAGYYTDDNGDGTYVLEARVGDTVAAGSSADQDASFATPITLQAGRNYWRALFTSNATLQTKRITSYGDITSRRPKWCMAVGATYATARGGQPGLPDTLSGVTIAHSVLVDIAGIAS